MALQNAVNVALAYGKETTFGTPATASAGKYIRRVSSSLALQKDTFSSNEARTDQQVFDLRHGLRKAAGGIETDFSLDTFNDWLASLLRGTWATGTSLSNTQLTSVVASAAGGTFTFAGGDPVALGWRVGDVIRFTAGVIAPNVNRNFRVVSFGGASNRTVTVAPSPFADIGTAVTTFTVAVQGKKLVPGILRESYTLEHIYPDIDVSERFVGCRMNSLALSLQPTGMATASWDILGQDGSNLTGAASPYFTTIAAAPSTGIFAGLSGSIRFAGAERLVVTGLDVNITNNLSSQAVVGSAVAPDVFNGRMVVTGNVSTYVEDSTILDAFANESEVDITVQMDLPLASGATAADFFVVNMQRVKFSGASKSIGVDGGVIATFPFQALVATATGRDATTLTMQRSSTV